MARKNAYDRAIEADMEGDLGNRIIESGPQIERRQGLTLAEFDAEFRNPGRPVVLSGIGREWPAWKKWTLEFFRRHYGNRNVTTALYSSSPKQERMGDVIDNIVRHDTGSGPIPSYLQEWPMAAEAPELFNDIRVPEYFQRNWLAEKMGFRVHHIWIGPRGAITPLHRDAFSIQTWNMQISGKKLWIVFGPNSRPVDTDEKIDFDEFLRDPKTQAHFYVSSPGEILFVPKGWWHRVKALETSVNMSGHILDEIDVPAMMKGLMISDCIGWLNAEKLSKADPGMAETYRQRARNRAKVFGLDPNDILGLEKSESFNTLTELVQKPKPEEVTNA